MGDPDEDNGVQITGDDYSGYNNTNTANGASTGTSHYNSEHDDQPIGIKEDG